MTHLTSPPSIPLDALQWEENGPDKDPKARLYHHIRVAGVDMHLEAWEVELDDKGNQIARAESIRAFDFDTMQTMMDCQFETVTINDREYFLIAVPYGR